MGDYIDRGAQIKETLYIVRSMVDSGNAIALVGNHEYNAICFHFPETNAGHLRKHSIQNILQHIPNSWIPFIRIVWHYFCIIHNGDYMIFYYTFIGINEEACANSSAC